MKAIRTFVTLFCLVALVPRAHAAPAPFPKKARTDAPVACPRDTTIVCNAASEDVCPGKPVHWVGGGTRCEYDLDEKKCVKRGGNWETADPCGASIIINDDSAHH